MSPGARVQHVAQLQHAHLGSSLPGWWIPLFLVQSPALLFCTLKSTLNTFSSAVWKFVPYSVQSCQCRLALRPSCARSAHSCLLQGIEHMHCVIRNAHSCCCRALCVKRSVKALPAGFSLKLTPKGAVLVFLSFYQLTLETSKAADDRDLGLVCSQW